MTTVQAVSTVPLNAKCIGVDGRFVFLSKVAPTLQGDLCLYLDTLTQRTVAIKRTRKILFYANRGAKNQRVDENIVKEANLLYWLSSHPSPPPGFVKFVDFFEDNSNFYLAQEYGGTDMFNFIVSQNEEILKGNLSIDDWNMRAQYLISVIAHTIYYFHYNRQMCHLDISLENTLIGELIDQSTGECIGIIPKIIDFGLSCVFPSMYKNTSVNNTYNINNATNIKNNQSQTTTTITNHKETDQTQYQQQSENTAPPKKTMETTPNKNAHACFVNAPRAPQCGASAQQVGSNTNSNFGCFGGTGVSGMSGMSGTSMTDSGTHCIKFVGKSQYKAPKVWYCEPFNAWKADVWSFGIMIFMIIVRVPPFSQPDMHNIQFKLTYSGNMDKLLKSWHKDNEMPELALDLLNHMLTNEKDRYNMKQVINHPYIKNAPKFEEIRKQWGYNVVSGQKSGQKSE